MTETTEDQYIPAPQEVGHEICGRLIFGHHKGMSLSLHALLYVVGVSKAAVGKMSGLTRGRINHYCFHGPLTKANILADDFGEPVPRHRAQQFHYILRSVIESFEENLTALKKDPKSFKAGLVKEAVPAAQAIVTTCRAILEAEQKAGWI